MKALTSRRFAAFLLLSFVVWAPCAWFDVAGQRALIYERGEEELYDWWMPRMCWEQGYAPAKSSDYGLDPAVGGVRAPDKKVGEIVEFSDWYPTASGLTFITGNMDKVYPALSILPFALFPPTRLGGYAWSVAAAIVFLLACWVCAWESRLDLFSQRWENRSNLLSPAIVFLIPLCMPFIFNLERGNPVWLSAAAVGVFLAWWDSKTPWKRYTAALCLAIAAVLKIAPAILGLLYVFDFLRKQVRPAFPFWRHPSFKCACFAGLCAIVLFFLPFLCLKEGFAALPIMIGNAAHHADFVLRTSDFGFIQIWRGVRVALGLPVGEPWPGMYLIARLSQILGLVSLLLGAKRRDYLLLVAGMLLAAGNMYYYAALYLIPVFILQWENRSNLLSHLSTLLIFVILCPLQLVLLGHSTNAILCNCCTLLLMGLHLLWGNRERLTHG